MVAKLIVSLDGKTLREYPLVRERVLVGRKPHNDIVITGMAVSGEHAVFIQQPDKTILEDLDSTNGVMVNDEPVSRRVLQEGDVIRIGRHRLNYVIDDSPAATGDGLNDVESSPRSKDRYSDDKTLLLSSGTSSMQRRVIFFAVVVVAFVVAMVVLRKMESMPEYSPMAAKSQLKPVEEVITEPVADVTQEVESSSVDESPADSSVNAGKEEAAGKEVQPRSKPEHRKELKAPEPKPGEQAASEPGRQDSEAAAKDSQPPVEKNPPKKPDSPEALCADSGNFISRSLCEIRVCRKPEWINHPFCVKLHKEQERNREKFL